MKRAIVLTTLLACTSAESDLPVCGPGERLVFCHITGNTASSCRASVSSTQQPIDDSGVICGISSWDAEMKIRDGYLVAWGIQYGIDVQCRVLEDGELPPTDTTINVDLQPADVDPCAES